MLHRHLFTITLMFAGVTSALAQPVTLKEGESAPDCSPGWVRTHVLSAEQFKTLFGPSASCREDKQPVYYLCIEKRQRFKVRCETPEVSAPPPLRKKGG